MMDRKELLVWGCTIASAVPPAILIVYDPLAGILLTACIWLALRCANLTLELRDYQEKEIRLGNQVFANQMAAIETWKRRG
jgi:hypothetical protein